MNTVQIVTPRDLLTEAVADLLVSVGGYKDAAEATREAELLFDNLTSTDAEDVAQAATQLRVLAIQAQGATNLLETVENDDSDQTFRFVAPEAGETLPEGPVNEVPQTFSDLLESIFGKGNVQIIREADLEPAPAPAPAPVRTYFASDRFVADPFGGFTRVG